MFYFLAFVLGSIWGSFCNVCIYRLPNNQSIVKGRSFCPSCKNQIKWYDNIPFLSFIFLKGKCRTCSNKISSQYFLVEFISAISFVIIYHLYGISITTLLLIILSIFFIIIFFVDLKHFIIPNELTFPMMFLGFVKSFDPNLNTSIFPNFVNSMIGGILGYLLIWSIIYFYKQIRKREGMGLGDAKLMAVIGFWFGWISIPFVIFLSSILALLIVAPSLLNKKRKMTSEIPFGPYIILAAVFYFYFSDQLKLLLF